MEIIKPNPLTKTHYKNGAKYIGGVDSYSFTFFGNFLRDRQHISTLLWIGLFPIIFIIVILVRGWDDVVVQMHYEFIEKGAIWWLIGGIVLMFFFIITTHSVRRKYINKESTVIKQINSSYAANLNLYKEDSIKFYTEGIQIKEKFFYWSEVKKIMSKGIIRVKRMKEQFYNFDNLDCYYYIALVTDENKTTNISFQEYIFRQFNNPVRNIRRLLYKVGRQNILEERGIEWIKGELDEQVINSKITNPFQEDL